MLEQKERLWDFDAVQAGQAGQPTVVVITKENISQYALAAQNPDPRYHRAGANPEYDGELMAMPSMALSYAPLLRDDIAANNGFVALEESKTARRQTPFAKCEIRWSRPVRAGRHHYRQSPGAGEVPAAGQQVRDFSGGGRQPAGRVGSRV